MAIELSSDVLTTEEQAQQVIRQADHARQIELETVRNNLNNGVNISHKLELLRHAKDVLIENRRNAPVSEREVTDEDIVKYATTLQGFLS